MDRRKFLTGAAAGVGAAALGQRLARGNVVFDTVRSLVPQPTATGVTHVVVLMMENRSVDHMLGFLGEQSGGEFDGKTGVAFNPALTMSPWGAGTGRPGGPDYAGCGYEDPGHGWDHGRVQRGDATYEAYLANPTNPATWPQGWLDNGSHNDEFALSYYSAADLPVHANLAREFTTFDRYFCSVLTQTFPNREYMHSAQSGGIHDNSTPPERAGQNPAWLTGFDWPTIWDLLEEQGISWGYYFNNLPATALWGRRLAKNTHHISNYYEDCALGRLPQVCFVDPYFVTGVDGFGNDDHPHADLRAGQQFVADVVHAFSTSPHWPSGALFVNYDEWGGFADRVPPPVLTAAQEPRANYNGLTQSATSDPRDSFAQMGFRVPALLVSPFARSRSTTGRVDHTVYDHVSILEFIISNYGLPSLRSRDANARTGVNNIRAALRDESELTPADRAPFTVDSPFVPEAWVPCELRGHTPPASDLMALAEMGWFETHGYQTFWSPKDAYLRTPTWLA